MHLLFDKFQSFFSTKILSNFLYHCISKVFVFALNPLFKLQASVTYVLSAQSVLG